MNFVKTDNTGQLFVGDSYGPAEYAAFFEANNTADNDAPVGGFLYISDRKKDEVIRHLEIYSKPMLGVKEDDVEIFWSDDQRKCGVAIWGQMRGIIDLARKQEKVIPLENPSSPGIADAGWLKGFDDYLDHNQFIRARQRYWKEMVKKYENVEPRSEQETPIATNFIRYVKGPDHLFAVFEDDGGTGYLYAFDGEQRKVMRHLHLYDRSEELPVLPSDVRVLWDKSGSKCAVEIWGKMRGIVDIEKGREGRVWLQSRDTPGIADAEWLSGFN